MTGAEFAVGLKSGQQQAAGLRSVIAAYQARVPVNTTIGSAALVSGLLAAVGFGAKYKLASDLGRLMSDADNLYELLRYDEDTALKLGDAEVSESLALAGAVHLGAVQALQAQVANLGGQVDSFAGAADVAATPAQAAGDVYERGAEAVGDLADKVSWWSQYGVTAVVVVVAALVLLFLFSPTARAVVSRAKGG